MSGVEVTHGIPHLVERVRPLNAWRHPLGLEEGREPFEVAGALLGSEHGEALTHEQGHKGGPQTPAETSCPPAAFLAPDYYGRPGGGEGAAQS